MILEDYLAGQYNRDLQDVTTIEQLLVEIARTFAASYDNDTHCWPYELKSEEVKPTGKPSQGTTAMILAAIGKSLGRCTLRGGQASGRSPGLPDALLRIFDDARVALVQQLRSDKKVFSGTFGENDPLTISHLTELARGLGDIHAGKKTKSQMTITIPNPASKKIYTLMEQNPASSAFVDKIGDGPYVRSAFLPLRTVRAQADLSGVLDVKSSLYKMFFETQLHEQLSFSSIPDSRFDPAELAFCMEGLLICAREAVDPLLFERVLAVLGAKQETSAYWRPSRPFMSKPTGEIMLPLSVEGANSLLRSVEIMDGRKLYDTFAAAAVPMFRRFWQWLRARKVEIGALGGTYIGWHSEHINEAGVIHLWDTSQVLEFLLGFRRLLQRHIARETLVLSRVKIDEPMQTRELRDPGEIWKSFTEKFEPLTDLSISPRIFDQVREDFVIPWSKGLSNKNCSMLVYGPPGTGKTKLASSISDTLGFRLITISVSDFLGAGGALVEARAKAIFQMLEAQSDCVVLFDEIDAFLLDRDSEHYRKQDTLFQFLTPGMLTKINDLRDTARCIFIIATNYANRIDPAIKRPGRIDRQYLLLPPDLKKRQAIIEEALAKRPKASPAEVLDLAKASLYLGYKEIVGTIDQLPDTASATDIANALRGTLRSSSHNHYLVRLTQETTFPTNEFTAMARMAVQAGRISEVNTDISSLDVESQKVWNRILSKSPDLKAVLSEGEVQG